MPTDLPDGFKGTKPPPIDPAWVSPHRLAPEPEREPVFAGKPVVLQAVRLVALLGVTAAIVGFGLAVFALGVICVKAAL